MSRIVFVWELGTSLSYISHFLKLAKPLRAQGHDVTLVVRELHNLRNLSVEGVKVLQAPVWLPAVGGLPEPPLNYAEILLRFGYHNPANVGGLVDAWRDLYRVLQPDLVVASHSPTALVAARSLNLTTATLGDGFLVPPRETPMPNMRPWAPVPPQRLSEAEALVLNTVNTLLEGYGVKRLAFLGELFDVQENFLTTFPELDHYPQRRGAHYYGPMFSSGSGTEAAWPEGDGPRVFGYLEPGARDFDASLQALSEIRARALVCAPGISTNAVAKWKQNGIMVSPSPFRLDSLLKDCDFALTYCGHGMVAQLLLAGVPLLMFPNHLERFLTAWRVQALGAGITINPEAAAPPLVPLMRSLFQESRYRQQARVFSERHADFDLVKQEAEMMQKMLQLAEPQSV
jgi:UDP:flavonoid glycosyltransferase YjiC (YdhE family)